MSNLLLLTNALEPSAEVLPALGLLLHSVRVAPAEASALIDTPRRTPSWWTRAVSSCRPRACVG